LPAALGRRPPATARGRWPLHAASAQPLLDRYDVRYVVVGPLERTTYGDAGVAKWDQLGRRVFDRDGTTIWELR